MSPPYASLSVIALLSRQNNSSQDVHILIPGTCDNVISQAKSLCRCDDVKDPVMRRLFCINWEGLTSSRESSQEGGKKVKAIER